MSNYTPYFMMHSINTVRGGMTKALLNRATILSAYLPSIELITFNFDPEYDNIRETLSNNGLLNKNVTLHNLYEFLAFNKHPVQKETKINETNQGISTSVSIEDGQLKKEESYEDGFLKDIDYFNKDIKRVKRKTFDRMGRLRKISFIDLLSNEINQTLYYSENGHCFLSNWYNEKHKCYKCQWFDLQGNLLKEFSNEKELRLFWLDILFENDENVILVSDSRTTDYILLNCKNPKVAKVVVIHSNHLKAPYTYGAPLGPKNEKVINKANEFDAMVFLTEKQKQDVIRQMGMRTTYHAISHPALKPDQHSHIKKEPLTAVSVGRFSKPKNHDQIIRAFQQVVKEVPHARLELWGFGKQEKVLQSLIESLHLEDHVFIKGFTLQPSAVFKRAAFSIVASSVEGFCMSISESLSEGTPVISYDINYGPSDMIKSGVNGILIPFEDTESLSKAMIELFTNHETRSSMSKEAEKIVDTMSEEKFAQNWISLFGDAVKQKSQRLNLEITKCEALSCSWKEKGVLHIEATLGIENATSLLREHLELSFYTRKRQKLIDLYSTCSFKWENETTLKLSGDLSLAEAINGKWINKGKWDIYVSCSALNFHEFARLSAREKLSLPNQDYYQVKEKMSVIPYLTIYQNISIDVKEETRKKSISLLARIKAIVLSR